MITTILQMANHLTLRIKNLLLIGIYSSFNILVYVVRDFRPWDVVTKVLYFLGLHFQFSSPWDAHRIKIQVIKVFGKSLQIMFNLLSPQILNLNHQKIMYFRHYVPWTKTDNMKRFF
jgi:hypothetical protein